MAPPPVGPHKLIYIKTEPLQPVYIITLLLYFEKGNLCNVLM